MMLRYSNRFNIYQFAIDWRGRGLGGALENQIMNHFENKFDYKQNQNI